MSDDDARDRYLQQALRHAPDADAAPPPALRDTILREARAAVAPAAAPTLGQRVRELLASAWHTMARPRFAAAFASLTAMTLAGVMWWGRPIEDAMPAREAPVAESAAPAVASAAAPPIDASMQVDKSAPKPAPAAEPRRRAAPVEARQSVAKSEAPAKPAEAPAEPAEAPAKAARAAIPEPAPVELRPAATAMADASTAPAPAAPAAPVAAKPAALGAAPGQALRQSLRENATVGVAAEIAWDRGDGQRRAGDAAFRTWLAQADAALAAGVPAGAVTADAASEPGAPAIAPLRVWRDGAVVRTLRLEGELLVDEAAGRPARRVRLAPGAAQGLAAALDRLPR